MKKIVFLLLIVIVGVLITGFSLKKKQLSGAEYVLDFIKNNPNKSALTLLKNNTKITTLNENRMQPLASTLKIVIAIEYAIQSANKTINANQLIDIKDLNIFYVPFTDGYAHYYWLESIKSKLVDNKISIREIAKGMIQFSSNANTEWLQTKLGLDAINKRLDLLKITDHDPIYYLASSLFIPKEVFPNLKGDALLEALNGLSKKEFINHINSIHNKLISDKNYKSNLGEDNTKTQRIWSNRLPSSTTNTYAQLMQKLNAKSYFSKEIHIYLDEVMEGLMQSEGNRANLIYAGQKGGSTAVVLTNAFYATDKKGNTTEMAVFFDDLSASEHKKLSKNLNTFIVKTLYNEAFQKQLANTFQ